MPEEAEIIDIAANDEPAASRPGSVRVAGLADLHVTDMAHEPYRELFTELNDTADVLVLAGDLTDFGRVREAEILAEDLRRLKIPVVGVLGNHDHECGCEAEVSRILRQAGLNLLGEHAHVAADIGFAGVKGFGGGFGRAMLGAFGEGATKAFVQEAIDECSRLEIAMRGLRTEKRVVVLHYAPVVDTVVGEPEQIYAFLGSARLGETIDRFGADAVIHGHAHRGAHRGQTANGIPVFNCAAGIPKEGGRPYAIIEI